MVPTGPNPQNKQQFGKCNIMKSYKAIKKDPKRINKTDLSWSEYETSLMHMEKRILSSYMKYT